MPAIKRKNNIISVRISDNMFDKLETLQSTLLPRSYRFNRNGISVTDVIEQSINFLYNVLIEKDDSIRIDTKKCTLDLSVIQNVIFERNK